MSSQKTSVADARALIDSAREAPNAGQILLLLALDTDAFATKNKLGAPDALQHAPACFTRCEVHARVMRSKVASSIRLDFG